MEIMKDFIKHKLLHIFLLFMTISLYSGDDFHFNNKEYKYLANKSVINIYVEPYINFYTYTEENHQNGYAIEYLHKISKKLNIRFNIINDISTQTAKMMLENGKLDMALFSSYHNNETSTYIYSKLPMGILRPSLLIPKIYQLPPFLDAIEEMKVVVIKGQGFSSIFKKGYPDFDTIEVDSVSEAIDMVKKQEVDVAAGFQEQFDSYINFKDFSFLQSSLLKDKSIFSSVKIYLSTYKNNAILMSIFDKVMDTFNYQDYLSMKYKFFNNNKLHQLNMELSLNEKEKFFLMKKKMLRICTVPDRMPYNGILSGEYIGIGSNISKSLEEILDIQIDLLITKSRKDSIKKLLSGECDFLGIVPNILFKNNSLKYTSKLLEVPLVAVTTNDFLYENNFKNISDRSFVIEKNLPIKKYLYEIYPNINLTEVSSDVKGIKLVEEGKYFALITSRLRVSNIFKHHIADNLKISAQLPLNINFGFSVKKENEILYNILEKSVSDVLLKEIDSAVKTWVSERYPKGFDYTIVLIVAILFIIFSIFVFAQQFNVSINNERLKIKQKTLSELNEELEKRVKADVEASRKKDIFMYRQSRYASMGEMIGNIAHQWRQPLMHISALLMELQAAATYNKKIEKKEVMDIIYQSNDVIKFMSQTIDNFKNFFALQKESAEFSINEVTVDAIKIMSSAFKYHNIQVKLVTKSVDSVLYGNKNEYAQVIINLLSNSKDMIIIRKIKNGEIIINIDESDGYSLVSVKDNAGGIENNQFTKIFEPFFTKNKPNGTGIGLFMSRMIIENHMKGSITVANIEDGAIFYVNVPNNKTK